MNANQNTDKFRLVFWQVDAEPNGLGGYDTFTRTSRPIVFDDEEAANRYVKSQEVKFYGDVIGYVEVYARSEYPSAKWDGFIIAKPGEEIVREEGGFPKIM